MTNNPFQSPPLAANAPSEDDVVENAKRQLRVPATLIILLAMLNLLFESAAVFLGIADSPRKYIVLSPLFALHLFEVYAGWQMLTLYSRPQAAIGAILVALPFCSPFFFVGIPIGWWALHLLGKPDVEEAFQRVNL